MKRNDGTNSQNGVIFGPKEDTKTPMRELNGGLGFPSPMRELNGSLGFPRSMRKIRSQSHLKK
jgi:hypothetical protein